jgi:hypothetical protein
MPAVSPRRPAGAVAQLGERRNRTAEVRGSNPLSSTNDFNSFALGSIRRPSSPEACRKQAAPTQSRSKADAADRRKWPSRFSAQARQESSVGRVRLGHLISVERQKLKLNENWNVRIVLARICTGIVEIRRRSPRASHCCCRAAFWSQCSKAVAMRSHSISCQTDARRSCLCRLVCKLDRFHKALQRRHAKPRGRRFCRSVRPKPCACRPREPRRSRIPCRSPA